MPVTHEQDQPSAQPQMGTPAAAAFIGVEPKTLVAWRSRGTGPPYRKLSARLIRYDPVELRAWLDENRVTPGEVQL